MMDPLPEATQKYFDICNDKLGMVPNVLQAYAFDIDKLNAFTTFYNDLMLANSGLTKLERYGVPFLQLINDYLERDDD